MNSVLSVSPFVSSIFFLESALKIFLIFCINLGGPYGTKNDLNRIFPKNLNFPKIGIKWLNMSFFLIFSKAALTVAKTVCEKENSFRSYFKSKMHQGSLLNDPFLYILYLV